MVQVPSVALGLGHAAGRALESLPLEGMVACVHEVRASQTHGFAKLREDLQTMLDADRAKYPERIPTCKQPP